MNELKISNIVINNRVREDMGDIAGLANNIKENGLLNPIIVNQNNVLIAGERRLKAFKYLNREFIPVKVLEVDDYEKMLVIEIAENEQRKDFTKEERVKYGEELEKIEEIKAKERMTSGANQYSPKQNFAEGTSGQTRDIVSAKVGLGSGETYRKSKEIVHNAPEPIKEAWNNNQISTHKAFQITKQPISNEEKIQQWQEAQIKKPKVIIPPEIEAENQKELKEIDKEHDKCKIFMQLMRNPKLAGCDQWDESYLDSLFKYGNRDYLEEDLYETCDRLEITINNIREWLKGRSQIRRIK